MRAAGIAGVRRGKQIRTTKPDPAAARHPDLVNRDFTATAPNQLWVTDLTFVPTWAGVAYVCFITDAFSRMIVGWRVAGHMRTTMVLDAIEMARWSRGKTLVGLRCHSDAGSQFTSIRYGERLAEIGAVPSIGTVGDSFDNALAETVNGYYKSELIYGPARTVPWKTVEDVELATLNWVHWHNTSRLHGYLGDLPPAEFEAIFYARNGTTKPQSKSNSPSLHRNQGDSADCRLHSWARRSLRIMNRAVCGCRSRCSDEQTVVVGFIAIGNSAALLDGLFLEGSLGFTVVRLTQRRVYVFDTRSRLPDAIAKLKLPQKPRAALSLLWDSDARLTSVSLDNTDIGRRAPRARTVRGVSIADIAPEMTDYAYVCNIAEGYTPNSPLGAGSRRYVGFQSISAARRPGQSDHLRAVSRVG
jgi:putative transposase